MEIKPILELEKLKIKWYNNTAVSFEIVKQMKYRETVFLSMSKTMTHRNLKINAVKFLHMNFLRYRFFSPENLYNVYSSLAYFPDMPMFSFSQTKKREQQDLFNLGYKEYLTGYDFLLDIDNEDIQLAYSSANIIKALFDRFKVRYHLKFSGLKGFHIGVLDQDLPKSFKQMEIGDRVRMFKLFAGELKRRIPIPDIDLRIYDERRIAKTPYSVAYPFYYVALPLSDEGFADFTLDDVFLPTLLELADTMRDRGLLVRDGEPDNLKLLFQHIAMKGEKSMRFNKTFKFKCDFLLDFKRFFQ